MENVFPPLGTPLSKPLEMKRQLEIDRQSWEQEALQIHNEYRRKHRVPELRLNADLTVAAKVSLANKSFVTQNKHLRSS